jgi:beta-ureidopropionase
MRGETSMIVRVAVMSWPVSKPSSVSDNLKTADSLLQTISPGTCDIVLLPEHFEAFGVYEQRMMRQCEDIDPEATFGDQAQRIGAIIAVPTISHKDGFRRVIVTLIAPNARSLGCYEKRHPWPCSSSLDKFEFDSFPGNSPAAIETPFGRVGMQVCFDVNYEVGWREIARSGAKLTLYPSAYPGGFGLRVRAWQIKSFVACSVISGRSRIVAPDGNELLDESSPGSIHIKSLNLNFCFVHCDHNKHSIQSLTNRHPEIQVTRYADDNIVKMEAPLSTGAIEDVLAEGGIRTLQEYLDRAEEVILTKSDRKRSAGPTVDDRIG